MRQILTPEERKARKAARDRVRHQAHYYADLEASRAQRRASYRKYRARHQAYHRAYHQAHAEKKNAASKRWHLDHPEEKQAYNLSYNLKNHARIVAQQRRYRQANPEKINAKGAKRRAMKLAAPINDLTVAEWEEIKAHYKHRCVYCGRKMQRLTKDHITPLFKGGSHTKHNVVPACQKCNSSKGINPPPIPVQPLLL